LIFRLLPQAEEDIGEIAVYIAHDDKGAAQRWSAKIRLLCEALADSPGMGVARDELRPGLRMMLTGNYLILYRIGADAVEIIRVLDGRRSWRSLI